MARTAPKSALVSLLAVLSAGLVWLAFHLGGGAPEPAWRAVETVSTVPATGAALAAAEPAAPTGARIGQRAAAVDALAPDREAENAAAPEAGLTLRGRIADLPGAEADVRVFALEGPRAVGRPKRARTAPDGRFECTGLALGRIQLVVSHQGVVELAREIVLRGDTDLGELEVRKAVGAEERRPGAAVRVAGEVRDSVSGATLAGASVRLGEELETRTDAQGRFRLYADTSVPVHGDERLIVSHVDYETRQLPLNDDATASLTVSLEPVRATRGRVVDTGGAPVADVEIEVHVAGIPHALPSEVVRSDANGDFALRLRDGSTTAVGRARELYAVHPDFAPTRLLLDGELDRIQLVLEAGASVAGRITGPGGAPVAAAEVLLLGADAERRTSSAEDGTYRIERVEPGAYEVSVDASGLALSEPAQREFASGEQRCDLVLAFSTAIEGRVVDTQGSPVAGARLALRGRSDAAASDDAGHFRLTGLAPSARHEVQASAPGHATTVVDLRAAGGEPVTVVLPRAASLTALAFDGANGQAIHNCHVLLRASEPGDGPAAVPLAAAGPGRFEARDLGPGSYTLSAQSDGRLAFETEVWLTAGEEAQVEIAFERGLRLAGHVVDELGSAVGGARLVWNSHATGAAPLVVETDGTGSFEATGLALGTCWLIIEHPDFPMAAPRELELAAGGGPLQIELRGTDAALPPTPPAPPVAITPAPALVSGESL